MHSSAPKPDSPIKDQRLRRERDLYRSILELGASESIEPFLDRALELIMSIVGARGGFLGLGRTQEGLGVPAEWSKTLSLEDDLEGLCCRVSSSIIRRAIQDGETIQTPSALLDDRFDGLKSVRLQKVEAVLCVPIPDGLGVVYLEGRRRTGPFPPEDVENVKLFAREVHRIANRLLTQQASKADDPTLPYRERLHLESLVGASPALAELFEEIEACSDSELTVLLTGETGTGKSLVAKVIHDHSPRADKPFVSVNCALFGDDRLESQLFGHVKGAFTGAHETTQGCVAVAEGGTLFLDEVAELSPTVQAKLLIFLDDGTYRLMGSPESQQADVRIVAATNTDLETAVREKRFRADLRYRLNQYPVRLPSLSERRSDIPLLLDFFCRKAAEKNGVSVASFSPFALAEAMRAEWPGNVRELAIQVQCAVVRAGRKKLKEIDAQLLFGRRLGRAIEQRSLPEGQLRLRDATQGFREQHVRRVLASTGGNITQAARLLGVGRQTLHGYLKSFSSSSD